MATTDARQAFSSRRSCCLHFGGMLKVSLNMCSNTQVEFCRFEVFVETDLSGVTQIIRRPTAQPDCRTLQSPRALTPSQLRANTVENIIEHDCNHEIER